MIENSDNSYPYFSNEITRKLDRELEWIENNYAQHNYSVGYCPDCGCDLVGWIKEDGITSYFDCS